VGLRPAPTESTEIGSNSLDILSICPMKLAGRTSYRKELVRLTLFPVIGLLEFGDIEFLHSKKGLRHSGGSFAIISTE
jgi:hypothetical protein